MIISAKFASKCPCCGLDIKIGSKVEWSRGAKASHVACGAVTSAHNVTYLGKVSVRPARGELRGRWTGCRCGSIEGSSRDSDCRQCQYDNE